MPVSPREVSSVRVHLIGGPTAIVEIGGLRLLTDPTFSGPGPQESGSAVLTKLTGPALRFDDLGVIDAVLLSHDQHGDNLDDAGRQILPRVPTVISTLAASQRLGDNVRGLTPWRQLALTRPDGSGLIVTAVPAVHGPDGMEDSSGPVIGFVVRGDGVPTVYISGDNASLRAVEEVAHHLGPVDIAVLFGGGARTTRLDAFLTFTSDQLVSATRILGCRRMVPVHCEGWAHLTQGPGSVREAFAAAGLAERLTLLEPGAVATI
jgi:L-ascorbate metabolism protein UlaG (beta-lactamase superfamily)